MCFQEGGGKKCRVGTKKSNPNVYLSNPQLTGVCLTYISAFLCYSRYILSDRNVRFMLYIRPDQPVAREQHLARDIVVILPTQISGMKEFLLNPSWSGRNRRLKQFLNLISCLFIETHINH